MQISSSTESFNELMALLEQNRRTPEGGTDYASVCGYLNGLIVGILIQCPNAVKCVDVALKAQRDQRWHEATKRGH